MRQSSSSKDIRRHHCHNEFPHSVAINHLLNSLSDSHISDDENTTTTTTTSTNTFSTNKKKINNNNNYKQYTTSLYGDSDPLLKSKQLNTAMKCLNEKKRIENEKEKEKSRKYKKDREDDSKDKVTSNNKRKQSQIDLLNNNNNNNNNSNNNNNQTNLQPQSQQSSQPSLQTSIPYNQKPTFYPFCFYPSEPEYSSEGEENKGNKQSQPRQSLQTPPYLGKQQNTNFIYNNNIGSMSSTTSIPNNNHQNINNNIFNNDLRQPPTTPTHFNNNNNNKFRQTPSSSSHKHNFINNLNYDSYNRIINTPSSSQRINSPPLGFNYDQAGGSSESTTTDSNQSNKSIKTDLDDTPSKRYLKAFAKLISINNPEVKEYLICKKIYTIGGKKICDLEINDRHRKNYAMIRFHKRGCMTIEPLSETSIKVNNLSINQPTLLRTGDQIKILDYYFFFQMDNKEGHRDNNEYQQEVFNNNVNNLGNNSADNDLNVDENIGSSSCTTDSCSNNNLFNRFQKQRQQHLQEQLYQQQLLQQEQQQQQKEEQPQEQQSKPQQQEEDKPLPQQLEEEGQQQQQQQELQSMPKVDVPAIIEEDDKNIKFIYEQHYFWNNDEYLQSSTYFSEAVNMMNEDSLSMYSTPTGSPLNSPFQQPLSSDTVPLPSPTHLEPITTSNLNNNNNTPMNTDTDNINRNSNNNNINSDINVLKTSPSTHTSQIITSTLFGKYCFTLSPMLTEIDFLKNAIDANGGRIIDEFSNYCSLHYYIVPNSVIFTSQVFSSYRKKFKYIKESWITDSLIKGEVLKITNYVYKPKKLKIYRNFSIFPPTSKCDQEYNKLKQSYEDELKYHGANIIELKEFLSLICAKRGFVLSLQDISVEDIIKHNLEDCNVIKLDWFIHCIKQEKFISPLSDSNFYYHTKINL